MLDHNTQTVTVNDKQFLISSANEGIIEINNKELYNILYNYLVNTDIPIFIKAIDSELQIFGYATCMFSVEIGIQLSLFIIDGIFAIIITNK